ncbi:MAG: c-type cytochrome [Chloroflexi bacterium]|nr:c-type cytochrome [Chloroflexota bacterium]
MQTQMSYPALSTVWAPVRGNRVRRLALKFLGWVVLGGMLAAIVGCSNPLADPALQATPTRNLRAPAPAPAEIMPPARPSVVRGKPLYEENCVACHGNRQVGYSIGTLFMNPKPTRFIYAENLRQDSPLTYYRAITKGVLGTAMPAWDLKLDVQQRWDVAFYARSLPATPDAFKGGKELYATHCTVCHGDGGEGNGPQAANQPRHPTALADPRYLVVQTGQHLWYATAGLPDLPDHNWASVLSQDERWQIVNYIWTFMYDPGFTVGAFQP